MAQPLGWLACQSMRSSCSHCSLLSFLARIICFSLPFILAAFFAFCDRTCILDMSADRVGSSGTASMPKISWRIGLWVMCGRKPPCRICLKKASRVLSRQEAISNEECFSLIFSVGGPSPRSKTADACLMTFFSFVRSALAILRTLVKEWTVQPFSVDLSSWSSTSFPSSCQSSWCCEFSSFEINFFAASGSYLQQDSYRMQAFSEAAIRTSTSVHSKRGSKDCNHDTILSPSPLLMNESESEVHINPQA
mmetsp:Transcript_46307/g.145286  ORF Transcript_46307/g.145286 Transcript_46307/m.145286 type:complete len:250 (+) Transcript_46307:253-1002(+)